jgi:hypothetical protein
VTVKELVEKLDTSKSNSWATVQERKIQGARQDIANVSAVIEQFQARNKLEHEQLSREAQNAVSQLTEDSQFLNHVREIIHFVKTA